MAKVITDGVVSYTDDAPITAEEYLKTDKMTIFIGFVAVIAYIALFIY